MAQEKIALAR